MPHRLTLPARKGKHCGLGKYHLRADVEAFNTKLNKLPTEIEKISYIIDAIENVGARMKVRHFICG